MGRTGKKHESFKIMTLLLLCNSVDHDPPYCQCAQNLPLLITFIEILEIINELLTKQGCGTPGLIKSLVPEA